MRITIKLKLAAAFGFVILLLVGSAVYGIISLSSLNDAVGNLISGPAKRLELALEAKTAELNAVRWQKNALLEMDPEVARKDYQNSAKSLDEMVVFATSGQQLATAEGKPTWDRLVELAKRFGEGSNKVASNSGRRRQGSGCGTFVGRCSRPRHGIGRGFRDARHASAEVDGTSR